MKNKKRLKILLICISAIITLVFIGFLTVKITLTNSAIDFLCKKYNADKGEIQLIDYERAKYFFSDEAIPRLRKGYYKWEFRYNNRNFFVNRIDGKFYDDYQLEDIEKWLVEWLQANIEKSIYLVNLSSEDLYKLQRSVDDNYYCFSSESFECFSELYNKKRTADSNLLTVYYTKSDVNLNKVYKNIKQEKKLVNFYFLQTPEENKKTTAYKNTKVWERIIDSWSLEQGENIL